MISPTGKGIRNDSEGHGAYGASRGGRVHRGTDYICEPGQIVVAPISGTVMRVAKPYSNEAYSGLFIQGEKMAVKLFYFTPNVLIGEGVEMGEPIGTAQDISKLHGPAMVPHIHLEIDSIDPEIFMSL